MRVWRPVDQSNSSVLLGYWSSCETTCRNSFSTGLFDWSLGKKRQTSRHWRHHVSLGCHFWWPTFTTETPTVRWSSSCWCFSMVSQRDFFSPRLKQFGSPWSDLNHAAEMMGLTLSVGCTTTFCLLVWGENQENWLAGLFVSYPNRKKVKDFPMDGSFNFPGLTKKNLKHCHAGRLIRASLAKPICKYRIGVCLLGVTLVSILEINDKE